MSGPDAGPVKPSVDVATAWQDWINASGGINGHPVKVYVQDTKGDPSTMLSAIATLVQTDHVVAMLLSDVNTEADAQPYLTSHKIPVVGAIGSDGVHSWGVQTNYFTTFTQQPANVEAQPIAAKIVNARRSPPARRPAPCSVRQPRRRA
jgi:branched-chain amino acid transport system substrate-binding protein